MKNRLSEIQVIPVKPNNGLVGFASLVLDENLYLGSIGIMTRPEGGYRLTYPTKTVGDRQVNIYHPINKSFALEIEKVVVSKFEDVTKSYVGHHQINPR